MIKLRDATENDFNKCVRLLGELQSATASEHQSSEREYSPDVFMSLVEKARGQIVIAEDDGVLLGMASTSYNMAMRYGGEYCQLEELIVTPAARGKNLGALLVQQVIDNARSRGCAEIGLYLVESTEHNQPFYEKCGFIVVGTELRLTL